MRLTSTLLLLLPSVAWALPAASVSSHSHAPRAALGLPFSTKGRDVVQSDGSIFSYAGTNWPGHQQGMIPEGLQYASVKDIVGWIVKLGLNSVRLTYSIEMIDDIIEKGADTDLETSLTTALGAENGTKVLDQILGWNPQFSKNTTRLQVFDAVAQELADQGVILHLDNHVSKAIWCCSLDDGNAWFGDRYFNVDNWIRGWSYIAKHAAENWASFASVGLRNEFRKPNASEPYDWYTWYVHMTAAADAVHTSAPDALIYFSGLEYDTYIDPIPLGRTLNGTNGTSTAGKTAVFNPEDFAYKDKIVLEIHKYDFEATQDTCPVFESKWYEKGFQALDSSNPATKHLFPVVISEYGFIQNGTYWNQTSYNRCLIEFVQKWKAGFFQWDLSGSYYVRTQNGATLQDNDETWGLLNHEWNATRSQITIDNSLTKLVQALLG